MAPQSPIPSTMTKEQEIYLGMFLTFEETVTLHEAGLAKWPEILAARNLITSRKGVISGLRIIQENGDDTEVGFKDKLRLKLNGQYAQLVKAIRGNTGTDVGMEAKYAKIKPSGLQTAADTEVESDILLVVQDAEGMLPQLDRAEITAAMLAEMKVLAAAYNKAIAQKGTAGDAAVLATENMAAEFDAINAALIALNKPINGMPDSKSLEREALKKAREIKNA